MHKYLCIVGDKVRHHFVCLTAVDGHLVELDGAYNSGPLVVKSLGEEMLLMAAASSPSVPGLTSSASANTLSGSTYDRTIWKDFVLG